MRAIDDAIAALDAALARCPDDATLRARREALLRERAAATRGEDLPELERRLDELERKLSEPDADTKLVDEYNYLREAQRTAVARSRS